MVKLREGLKVKLIKEYEGKIWYGVKVNDIDEIDGIKGDIITLKRFRTIHREEFNEHFEIVDSKETIYELW